MKAYLVTALLCLMPMAADSDINSGTISKLVIADKGVSHYTIVVSENTSPSENHAAEELKYFL